MKLNKILALTLVLLAISLTLGSIYAASGGFTEQGNALVYKDVTINIPEGYELVENEDPDIGWDGATCTLENGDKEVSVDVIYASVTITHYDKDGNIETPETKTINDIEGDMYKTTGINGDDIYEFNYDTEGAHVTIKAPDEETITQMVK